MKEAPIGVACCVYDLATQPLGIFRIAYHTALGTGHRIWPQALPFLGLILYMHNVTHTSQA